MFVKWTLMLVIICGLSNEASAWTVVSTLNSSHWGRGASFYRYGETEHEAQEAAMKACQDKAYLTEKHWCEIRFQSERPCIAGYWTSVDGNHIYGVGDSVYEAQINARGLCEAYNRDRKAMCRPAGYVCNKLYIDSEP